MNELLAGEYSEAVHRLAAGIEPRDALRGTAAGAAGLAVTLEEPRDLRAARPLAHAGGRWSIRYVPRLPGEVVLRIEAPGRRFVARRLRVAIVPLADLLAAESGAERAAASRRTWRPLLFPGATYPLASTVTAIRGRVLRNDGTPARWARVEAKLTDHSHLPWRAHGDDRGEYLLVIGPDPRGLADLPHGMTVTITAYAHAPGPPPSAGVALDPLWDLPIEQVAPVSRDDDGVSSGMTLPPGYKTGPKATGDAVLIAGQIASDVAPLVLPAVLSAHHTRSDPCPNT